MKQELALPYVPIDPMMETLEETRRFVRAVPREMRRRHTWLGAVSFLLDCGKHKVDGVLGPSGSVTDEDLADMGSWDDDPKAFAQALRAGGFIADIDGVLRIPLELWKRFGGRVLTKREEWRQQKFEQRNRRTPEESTVVPVDASRTETEGRGTPAVVHAASANVRADKPPGPPDVARTPPVSALEVEVEVEVEVVNKSDHSAGASVAAPTPEAEPPSAPVDADQLIELMRTWEGWLVNSGVDPGDGVTYGRRAVALQPFSPKEIKDARARTQAMGGKPNLGLFLGKLRYLRWPSRGQPPRPKSPRADGETGPPSPKPALAVARDDLPSDPAEVLRLREAASREAGEVLRQLGERR